MVIKFGPNLERWQNINDCSARTNRKVTALHSATTEGHVEVVKMLLRHPEINVDKRNDLGQTAYLLACGYRELECMRALADAGADTSATTNRGGTALMCALSGQQDGGVQKDPAPIIQAIVDRGADVHARDSNGSTAFHLSCLLGNFDCIEILLRAGFDVETKDKEGNTGMHIAQMSGGTDGGDNHYRQALERVKIVREEKRRAEEALLKAERKKKKKRGHV